MEFSSWDIHRCWSLSCTDNFLAISAPKPMCVWIRADDIRRPLLNDGSLLKLKLKLKLA